MALVSADASEVFTANEIARAAGAPRGLVRELIRGGAIATLPGGFIPAEDAVSAVRLLRASDALPGEPREPLTLIPKSRSRRSGPLAASAAAHAAVAATLMLAASLGLSSPTVSTPYEFKPVRMVFLAIPGPGGGGGGGGLRQPAPPRQARLEGSSRMRSPVPVSRAVKSQKVERAPKSTPPLKPAPVEKPVEPPPPAKSPDPAPPVVAPVASVAADSADRPGTLTEAPQENVSRGNGEGGGSGTGTGSGIGEGTGPGIGPGSGGGTGGGPYRPGSGITPPGLLREVKPDYTEEARRRGIEGQVVLEIVVRSDGSVGNTRVLRGLGAGLDQRATEAVRQWRFSPARRHGTPVDVMVEVEVEFRIR